MGMKNRKLISVFGGLQGTSHQIFHLLIAVGQVAFLLGLKTVMLKHYLHIDGPIAPQTSQEPVYRCGSPQVLHCRARRVPAIQGRHEKTTANVQHPVGTEAVTGRTTSAGKKGVLNLRTMKWRLSNAAQGMREIKENQ